MRELSIPLLISVMVLSILIGSSTLTRGEIWGDDFAAYIMQAKSILDGNMREFVEHNAFTVHQSSFQTGPVAYPWGYPLILTPLYASRGLNALALKMPGLLFFAGFLFSLFLLVRARLAPAECVLFVALFAFNPLLLRFLDRIGSDIPFLAVAMLSMVMMSSEGKRKYCLLGLILFAAFFIRTIGVILLMTFCAEQLRGVWSHRNDRGYVKKCILDTSMVIAVFGILCFLSVLIFPSGQESYFARYRSLTVRTVLSYVVAYVKVVKSFFGQGVAWTCIYCLLVGLSIVGVWARRTSDRLFIIFSAIWMIVHITWPGWQGLRYLFPILPMFVYFAFQGMNRTFRYLPAKSRRMGAYVGYMLWCGIICAFAFQAGEAAYGNLKRGRWMSGPFDSNSMAMYNYIKENTPKSSVIIFFKPRLMHLMTDRNSLMVNECNALKKGDYIVIAKVRAGKKPPNGIEACSLPARSVFENRQFIIYLLVKERVLESMMVMNCGEDVSG